MESRILASFEGRLVQEFNFRGCGNCEGEPEGRTRKFSIPPGLSARLLPVPQSFTFLNRRELAITDTELKLIAAAARMGLSSMPKNGYSTPAAIGTPTEL